MELIHTKLFFLLLTLGVYIVAQKLYLRFKFGWLNPIFISILIICCFLGLFEMDYSEYKEHTEIITFLLGPSVVALGYKLYEQYEQIKQNMFSILIAVTIGSLISVMSVILVGMALGVDNAIIASLQPKSVTTPIAITLSRQLHGIPAITVVVTLGVGIFCAISGPELLKKAGVTSPMAIGLAMGSTAHGLGTARAFELGALQGAISGMAIGIMGIITSFIIPIIDYLIHYDSGIGL